MNIEIENAIGSWLRTQTDFDGIAVHTGQSSDEIPGDQPIVVVSCENAESPVSGLYKSSMQITVSTPIVLEGALDTHRFLTAALRRSVDLSGVSAFFPEALAFSGRHLTSWSEARENDRLHTTAEIVIGVREI